jgi:hypothetical protein
MGLRAAAVALYITHAHAVSLAFDSTSAAECGIGTPIGFAIVV